MSFRLAAKAAVRWATSGTPRASVKM
jgi:hypothetical protein